MQLKKNEAGSWTVYLATRPVGEVRRVKQNPAYGRGSGPISDEVMVWGAFIGDRRVGMDFRTRRGAASAIEQAVGKTLMAAESRWRPEDYVAG